mmetsp:Transcript_12992/g.25214  ORF Transcript_12992/g.25214 Transcript_12992/m.25214 type:complete len:352 (-) Transcript_12992:166-1221(-)|eukprot:CAMPEP_0171526154 /NCGR_PEP_ID=MMETSP0959-20130129/10207_1 /TAXON_ID=87120 /ORGANISM="Aurantiochytrium limacinum, Strain ATCCMYA-1381" /LENGTH=351 /DNA_ID=CAMNT_0012067489 /DNA_START=52 /DNA_END=1107 /DNA_ORIENTATION=+
MDSADKPSVAWMVYAVLAVAGTVLSQYCLYAWLEEDKKAIASGSPSDLLSVFTRFFNDTVSNYMGVALYYSIFTFTCTTLWSFVTEASRRRANVSTLVPAVVPALSLGVAACSAVPAFMALIQRAEARFVPRGMPQYELGASRAFNILFFNLMWIVGFILVMPGTASAWPGGQFDSTVFAVVALAAIAPPFAMPFDGTRGVQRSDVEAGTPTTATNEDRLSDREFAHYLIMTNSGLTALIGLFVHLYAWACILQCGSLAVLYEELTANWATIFLLVDYVILVLAAYFWLEVEAMGPVRSASSIRSSSRDGPLQWRDLLSVTIFGPICHFSIAFASREYGLLKLDGLQLKSN